VVLSALVLAGVGGSAPSGTAGDIDPTFGDNGVVLSSISTYGAEAHAVVVQPDGKLVLAGWTEPPPPPPLPPLSTLGPPSRPEGEIGNKDFLALRLNADGNRDSGFGSDGFVRTEIGYVPGAANGASAVALGPDGSIVLGGFALEGLYTTDFAYVRYTSAGELDPTFSGDGIQTIDIGDYEGASGVVVQPSDGKIIAVGRSEVFDRTFTAMRLNVDGTLDGSFGSGGVSRLNLGESFVDSPAAVTLTPAGTILAAGTADYDGAHGDFALVRYLPDGQPDPAFGVGGVAITHDPANEQVSSLALAPDGKILVSGAVYEVGGPSLRIERYLADGQLDPTFGGTGIVTTTFGNPYGDVGVTVQADGKIVASVPVSGAPGGFGLVRYAADGTIDPTFGGGTRVYELGTGYAAPSAVAIQDGGSPIDERIIEVGKHYDSSANRSDMAAIRVLTGPPGQPPPPGPPPPPPPVVPPPPPAPAARCRVPRVVRLRLARARTRIRRAHCRVGRVRSVRSRRFRGIVVKQSPRAGRRVARGTRVNLVVGRR
jgi:uncharacterized delta-60 repeat protein